MNRPRNFNLSASRDADVKRILKEGNDLVEALDESKVPERRRYPESEFRKHFLPIVNGEAYQRLAPGYTEDRLREEANQYWLQVAGSPNLEVEVVESDGTTAFIVPALMDTSVINTFQPSDRAGLRQLNREYQDKSVGLPQIASRLMERGLSQALGRLLVSEPDRREAAKKIDKIREYYQLPEDTRGADSSQSKPTDQAGGFMGDMSFD